MFREDAAEFAINDLPLGGLIKQKCHVYNAHKYLRRNASSFFDSNVTRSNAIGHLCPIVSPLCSCAGLGAAIANAAV